MDLFQRTDKAIENSVGDEAIRADIEAKARVNRALTLAAAMLLLMFFLVLSLLDAPVAEIIGVIASINFALFLKSDSDVKQAIVVRRLARLSGAEGDKESARSPA